MSIILDGKATSNQIKEEVLGASGSEESSDDEQNSQNYGLN